MTYRYDLTILASPNGVESCLDGDFCDKTCTPVSPTSKRMSEDAGNFFLSIDTDNMPEER